MDKYSYHFQPIPDICNSRSQAAFAPSMRDMKESIEPRRLAWEAEDPSRYPKAFVDSAIRLTECSLYEIFTTMAQVSRKGICFFVSRPNARTTR